MVRNERLIAAEARAVVEETEAAGNVLGGEIGPGVKCEFVAGPSDANKQNELIDQRADLRVVVDGDPRRSDFCGLVGQSHLSSSRLLKCVPLNWMHNSATRSVCSLSRRE